MQINQRSIVNVLALVAIAGGCYGFWWQHTRPSYYKEEAEVDAKISEMHDGNVAKLQNETKPRLMRKWVKNVDVAGFKNGILPSATRSAELDNAKNAWLARATHRVPVRREKVLWGGQMAPRTMFPSYEPMLVVISRDDLICTGSRPYECSYADGLYKEGFSEKYPNRWTVLQVPGPNNIYGGREGALPGNYHAHIARVCNNGRCGDWVQTGFVYAVCRPGNEQQWFNGFVRIGKREHVEDFFGGTGYFTFDADPDPLAQWACAEHPDKDIVPNLDLAFEPPDPGAPVPVSTTQ
jgi:hypothetical protein